MVGTRDTKFENRTISKENDALIRESQKRCQGIGEESEDGLSQSGPQNEEPHNELDENADNDRLPINVLPVSAGDEQS